MVWTNGSVAVVQMVSVLGFILFQVSMNIDKTGRNNHPARVKNCRVFRRRFILIQPSDNFFVFD